MLFASFSSDMMSRLCGALLCFISFCTCAQPSITPLSTELERMEKLRSSSVADFIHQLPLLESELFHASPYERDYYRLLQAYRLGLSGQLLDAYQHLEPLLASTTDPNLRTRAMALAVNVLVLSKNYRDAFHYLNELSLTLHQGLDGRTVEQASAVIALTLLQLSKYDEAQYYIQLLQQTASSDQALCHANYLQIEVLFGEQRWQELEAKVGDAVALCVLHQEHLYSLLILNKYHEMLIEDARFVEAIEFYNAKKNDFKASQYPIIVAQTMALAAEAYMAQGELGLAHSLLSSARDKVDGNDTHQASRAIFKASYLLAEAEGDYQQALADFKEFSYRQSDFHSDIAAREQAFQLAKVEISAKLQQIELLSKDNQLLHLQQQVLSKEAQNARLLLGNHPKK